jgi:hypothetical protein
MRLLPDKAHQARIIQFDGCLPQRARCLEFAHRLVERRREPVDPPRQRPRRNRFVPRSLADRGDHLRPVRIPMAPQMEPLERRKLSLAVHQFCEYLTSIGEVGPKSRQGARSGNGCRPARRSPASLRERCESSLCASWPVALSPPGVRGRPPHCSIDRSGQQNTRAASSGRCNGVLDHRNCCSNISVIDLGGGRRHRSIKGDRSGHRGGVREGRCGASPRSTRSWRGDRCPHRSARGHAAGTRGRAGPVHRS